MMRNYTTKNSRKPSAWKAFIENYSKDFALFKFEQLTNKTGSNLRVATLYQKFTGAVSIADLIYLCDMGLGKGNGESYRIFMYLLRSSLEWNMVVSLSRALSRNLSDAKALRWALTQNKRYLNKVGFKDPCEAFSGLALEVVVENIATELSKALTSEASFKELVLSVSGKVPHSLSQLQNLIYKPTKPISLNNVHEFKAKVWSDWNIDNFFKLCKYEILVDVHTKDFSRSFCVADCLGKTLYLSVAARPNWSSYSTLLHELGHALHVIWESGNNLNANIYLNPQKSEGAAFLFELLVKNKSFANSYLLPKPSKAHLLWIEYSKRRYLILTLLESVFYGKSALTKSIMDVLGVKSVGGSLSEVYEILCNALLFVRPDDGDPIKKLTLEFYHYQAYQAFQTALLTQRDLETTYGRDWYKQVGKPPFLEALFSKFA